MTLEVNMLVMNNLNEAIAKAAINRSHLIFLPNSLKQDIEVPVIDLNKVLSEQLIDLPRAHRPKSIINQFKKLIDNVNKDEIFIDGIQILFDRSLAIEPLSLLKSCSMNKILMVCWPGNKTSTSLSYGIPSHPEYRVYKKSDLEDIVYLDLDVHLNRGML